MSTPQYHHGQEGPYSLSNKHIFPTPKSLAKAVNDGSSAALMSLSSLIKYQVNCLQILPTMKSSSYQNGSNALSSLLWPSDTVFHAAAAVLLSGAPKQGCLAPRPGECFTKSSPFTSSCSILRAQTHGDVRTPPCFFLSLHVYQDTLLCITVCKQTL